MLVRLNQLSRLLTLKPPDLCGRSIALVVACGNAENDGRFGCVIDMGCGQRCIWYGALIVWSTVDTYECQLSRRWLLFVVRRFHGQIHGIFENLSLYWRWRFPWQMGTFGWFWNFDCRRCAGETGQTCFEWWTLEYRKMDGTKLKLEDSIGIILRNYLAPVTTTAAIQCGQTEAIWCARFQWHSFECGQIGKAFRCDLVWWAIPIVVINVTGDDLC